MSLQRKVPFRPFNYEGWGGCRQFFLLPLSFVSLSSGGLSCISLLQIWAGWLPVASSLVYITPSRASLSMSIHQTVEKLSNWPSWSHMLTTGVLGEIGSSKVPCLLHPSYFLFDSLSCFLNILKSKGYLQTFGENPLSLKETLTERSWTEPLGVLTDSRNATSYALWSTVDQLWFTPLHQMQF